MVSVSVLKNHIENLNKGIIDLNEVDLNNRADLVRFEGYTVLKAAMLTNNELNNILDEKEFGSDNENEWGFTCSVCGKNLHMEYVDDENEGYLTSCKCGKKGFISIYEIDNIEEYKAIDNARNAQVKEILKNKSLCQIEFFGTDTNEENPQILSDIRTGKCIQKLETNYEETEEYYLYNNTYYTVRIDSLGRGIIYEIIK